MHWTPPRPAHEVRFIAADPGGWPGAVLPARSCSGPSHRRPILDRRPRHRGLYRPGHHSHTDQPTQVEFCPADYLGGAERCCGGARGIRTPDLLIANETRYQLRHSPRSRLILAPLPGFLASSATVSPPTAPGVPQPPQEGRTTRRPRAVLRGSRRGRWGGRALPRRPPPGRERRCRALSAGARAPAPRCLG